MRETRDSWAWLDRLGAQAGRDTAALRRQTDALTDGVHQAVVRGRSNPFQRAAFRLAEQSRHMPATGPALVNYGLAKLMRLHGNVEARRELLRQAGQERGLARAGQAARRAQQAFHAAGPQATPQGRGAVALTLEDSAPLEAVLAATNRAADRLAPATRQALAKEGPEAARQVSAVRDSLRSLGLLSHTATSALLRRALKTGRAVTPVPTSKATTSPADNIGDYAQPSRRAAPKA